MVRDYQVLIVDDDAIDRRLYCKLLMQPGQATCHIQQAINGAAGLAALRKDTFDCVLLDFNLPAMNGIEFLAAAAVDGELPCAVVLITGKGNEAVAVEAMKRGAQDYLVKGQVNATSLWLAMTQAVFQVELRQRLTSSLRELSAANLALGHEIAMREATEAELLAAKEAAERANELKTRFVAMITHELRTPLNGILGYAQLLRVEGGLSSRQDMQVGAMTQAGRHLLDMIDGVLDFASIEAGHMELHPEQVSIRDLTEACIGFISPMAVGRELSLQVVNTHDAPRHFVTDPARLRQVLLNLLGNAVKYTASGSVELRVLAGATVGGLRIEVADTGCGINAACRDRLFKDFERLEKADLTEGTGLGLVISARIVALMGGVIDYMDNSNGGSVFWLELPAIDRPLLPQTNSPAGLSLSRCRILVVDDIPINLDVIGSFLNAAGHTVILAESGEKAVRLATEERFDIILMDVRMPQMDGLEATRHIRTLPGLRGQVPILALSVYTSFNQITQCLNAGMNGHVPKPVDYETLIRAIDAILNRVPSHRTADPLAALPNAAGSQDFIAISD